MKTSIRHQLASEVEQSGSTSLVIVGSVYADAFRPPPIDGRIYVIQDKRRPWLKHVSGPSGTFTIDDHCPKYKITCYLNGVRVKPKYAVKENLKQIDKAAHYASNISDEPAFRLIGIKRVENITGFGKSYIYENCGKSFPQRISFGASKRSASRWVESEVIAWVHSRCNTR